MSWGSGNQVQELQNKTTAVFALYKDLVPNSNCHKRLASAQLMAKVVLRLLGQAPAAVISLTALHACGFKSPRMVKTNGSLEARLRSRPGRPVRTKKT